MNNKLENKKQMYKQLAIDIHEKESNKITKNHTVSNYMPELLFLLNKIPNWEFYFKKSIHIKVLKYIQSYKSISDVEKLLNVTKGSIHTMVFGSGTIKEERGLYGHLKKIYNSKQIYQNNQSVVGDILIKSHEQIVKEKEVIKQKQKNKVELLNLINSINIEEFFDKDDCKILKLYSEGYDCRQIGRMLRRYNVNNYVFGNNTLKPSGLYARVKKVYRDNYYKKNI